jgi:hypothetical protein
MAQPAQKRARKTGVMRVVLTAERKQQTRPGVKRAEECVTTLFVSCLHFSAASAALREKV